MQGEGEMEYADYQAQCETEAQRQKEIEYEAQTEQEQNKHRMLKCRVCPKCEGIMIQSMCLMGAELVCVPCQYGVGIFNREQEVYVPYDIHDKIYEKYSKDIHKLAFEHGGATCSHCNNRGGNNCKKCNIDYDYEYIRKD